MPLPGYRLIPAGWSQHHAPAIVTAMDADVVVLDPARSTPGPLLPDGTRAAPQPYRVVPAPDDHDRDSWPARIQATLGQAERTRQADETSAARDYLVQLADVPLGDLPDIEEGMTVRVVAAVNDPHLVGVDLEVLDVQHGSERFTRDLITRHNQQPPTG